jgi:hypothetical protein
LQVGSIGVGLFDGVVKKAGGDHVVGRAGAVEQAGDLEWVNDEGGAVGCAPLACVLALGVGERLPSARERL